jgi:hypothetical protein
VEYQRLVAALTAAAGRRAAELVAAEQAYADGVAAAEAELAELTAAADRAERWAAGAATAVVAVDREAERLWAELRRVLGWRGALLGDPPAPAEPVAGVPGPVLLARAAHAVAGLRADREGRGRRQRGDRRGGRAGGGAAGRHARRTLPWWAVALLPVLGAGAAAVIALAAGGLVTLSGLAGGSVLGGLSLARALGAMGWLAFLAAPFAGVPVAVAVGLRRFGVRPDAGGVALTVVAGMVAACAIALALR